MKHTGFAQFHHQSSLVVRSFCQASNLFCCKPTALRESPAVQGILKPSCDRSPQCQRIAGSGPCRIIQKRYETTNFVFILLLISVRYYVWIYFACFCLILKISTVTFQRPHGLMFTAAGSPCSIHPWHQTARQTTGRRHKARCLPQPRRGAILCARCSLVCHHLLITKISLNYAL